MQKKAFLILENGMVFEGERFGFEGEALGELVFTTSMTGYLETLTDPSYYGQIVVQTFPLIGNYGVMPEDFESPRPALTAYIVREWCRHPSNFRSQGDLDAMLKKFRIPGLCGIDTRQLTKAVREAGVMNAWIKDSPVLSEEEQQALRDFVIRDAVAAVTCKKPEKKGKGKRVVLWDFGAKENIRRTLIRLGAEVVKMPASSTAEQILAQKPDGVMLSNGPGDPAENGSIIAEIRKLIDTGIPVFGICLGHQLVALAMGARTEKLKYGHRGANQPVKYLKTGRTYITSQNHGYAVVTESLPDFARLAFVNANDGTCEGVDYEGMKVFTTQFHPEACGGPQDTGFLFERLFAMMEEKSCR